jgi:hypothetical protein
MHLGMARSAKGDQVLLTIVAGAAPEFFVMSFKIRHRATGLASPAISAEHPAMKLFVRLGVEPQRRGLWAEKVHDAFTAK